jgi:hypothetical protein
MFHAAILKLQRRFQKTTGFVSSIYASSPGIGMVTVGAAHTRPSFPRSTAITTESIASTPPAISVPTN